MSEAEDLPSAEERRQALYEMLKSDGWQIAVLPALRKLRREARDTLETSPRVTIEEVRALQAEIGLLTRIIEDPREIFGS